MTNQQKGKKIESVVFKYFNDLKDELSKALNQAKPDFECIDKIEVIFTQGGGTQKGKDRILILHIKTKKGLIKIPIITECKGNESASVSPKELDIHAKFNQIESSIEARNYINSQEFVGASFMLFMPFAALNNTEITETINNKIDPENIKFPDHYWEISNNPNLDKKIFTINKEICKDLLDSKGFTSSKDLLIFSKDDAIEQEIVADIVDNILTAYDKHIKNFRRVRNILNEIVKEEKSNEPLNDEANNKLNQTIMSAIVFDGDKDQLQKKYQSNITDIEKHRLNYLLRQINIQLNGGYFGDIVPQIEEHFKSLFIEYPSFFSNYENFREFEKNVLDIIGSSIKSFGRFDDNSDIVETYLLSDPTKRLGCFYQKVIEGMAKFKLLTNEIEIFQEDDK